VRRLQSNHPIALQSLERDFICVPSGEVCGDPGVFVGGFGTRLGRKAESIDIEPVQRLGHRQMHVLDVTLSKRTSQTLFELTYSSGILLRPEKVDEIEVL